MSEEVTNAGADNISLDDTTNTDAQKNNEANIQGGTSSNTIPSEAAIVTGAPNANVGGNPHAQRQIDTYIGLQNENSLLEIDLATARQKGEEIRYLALSFTGLDVRTNEPQQAFVNLDENSFMRLKHFFSQLEWDS